MITYDVFYNKRPEEIEIRANGDSAVIEFPVNVTEVETEDGTEYHAEKVYAVKVRYTENLLERVKENKEAWLDIAKVVETPKTTVNDLVDAINALTDMVIGGMV